MARLSHNRLASFSAALLALAVLSACGGGGSATDQVNDFTSTSGSGSNSSSSCNSNYSDELASATRANAGNDPQCSSYVAYADSLLATARSNCVAGNAAAANQYYENYLKAATHADASVDMLCGSDGGTAIDTGNSGGASLTLYIEYSSTISGRVLSGKCDTSTPSARAGSYWLAVAQNLTSAQCDSKAAEYGLTKDPSSGQSAAYDSRV